MTKQTGGGLLGPYTPYTITVTNYGNEHVDSQDGPFILDALAPLGARLGLPDSEVDRVLDALRHVGTAESNGYLFTLRLG